jgi:hypothetical protein
MENKTLEPLPEISKQKKKNVVFDQTRFVTGLKSALDQLPEDLTGIKP